MTPDPIDPYRTILRSATMHAYALHRDAQGAGDALATGVWGAVFLEAFLEEAIEAAGLSGGERDLGGMVNRLRGAKTLRHGAEVLNQCDMVRVARNALVHAGASPGQVVATHAATIAGNLPHILRLAQPWFVGVRPAEAAEPAYPPMAARVFVSTITPHLQLQDLFLLALYETMRWQGLEPIRVVLDEYDKRDPVRKIIETLRRCDALLCVGLERSHAYFLREREGSDKARETLHGFYSSGWLNLEAGAAFALELPVFVMCQSHIMSDGVFDRDWNSAPTYVIESNPPTVDDPAVQRCLARLADVLVKSVST